MIESKMQAGESKLARCVYCKQQFPVKSFGDGVVNCPHCGKITPKMSPGEWAKWEQEQIKAKKQMKIVGIVLLVVIGLAVWGVSSCVGKYRDHRRAEIEDVKLHGTIGMARQLCEKKLKSELKAPSTAKITYDVEERREENLYAFSGYVDAQNSFGAMIRNRFGVVISYNPDKGEYHVEAFDIAP